MANYSICRNPGCPEYLHERRGSRSKCEICGQRVQHSHTRLPWPFRLLIKLALLVLVVALVIACFQGTLNSYFTVIKNRVTECCLNVTNSAVQLVDRLRTPVFLEQADDSGALLLDEAALAYLSTHAAAKEDGILRLRYDNGVQAELLLLDGIPVGGSLSYADDFRYLGGLTVANGFLAPDAFGAYIGPNRSMQDSFFKNGKLTKASLSKQTATSAIVYIALSQGVSLEDVPALCRSLLPQYGVSWRFLSELAIRIGGMKHDSLR